MTSRLRFGSPLSSSFLLAASVLSLAGCPGGGEGVDAGGSDAPVAPTDSPVVRTDTPAPPVDAPTGPPIFRNPVTLPDDQLAMQALAILGAGSSFSCAECHGLTRAKIREWEGLSNTALSSCLTDLDAPSAAASTAMIECLRGGSATGGFDPTRVGVFATAAELAWFPYVFQQAYGTSWRAEYDDFVASAGMPAGGRAGLNQASFDIVAEWFIRGVPMLDDLVPDGMTGTCTPMIGPEVATYVANRATTGWRALNASRGLLMHGCAGATTALDCLATETLASTTPEGANWDDLPDVPGSRMRILFRPSAHSSFWTRSSADGRFVGHGGGHSAGSAIVDLVRDVSIGVSASYDPAFFPDNSGWMMLGGGGICETRVLTTGAPTLIDFSEPGCTGSGMVGLYEHVGASLGGADYWAIHGQFVSDSGGHSVTRDDPAANFDAGTMTNLTRLVNTGTGFTSVETARFATPNEGDAVLSASSGLIITRLAGTGGQIGWVLRQVTTTSSPATVTAPVIARYCSTGGKGAFSFDERYYIYHHYIGSSNEDAIELGFTGLSDPGFAEYAAQGAANIYLLDLVTGTETRITNMDPGQYALFPHFRSDGWIYFLVRQPTSSGEIIVASDAALLLE